MRIRGARTDRFSTAVLAFVLCPAVVAGSPARDFSGLERIALQEMKQTRTPGVALAVIQGDRVVLARGFGIQSIESAVPVTPETLFQIGSLTKVFTATAALTLSERGKIVLHAPIGDVVKGLTPCLARVTLDQLLAHASGLKDEPADYGSHDEAALATYARTRKEDACLFPPGQVFSYSNPGYALAGLALEEAGGEPYADQMAQSLFGPLGMERTTFRPTLAMTYPMAAGHRGGEHQDTVVVRPYADDTRYWPAGYMATSVSDLARFVIALLNEGRLKGRQVLSPSVVSRLFEPHADLPAKGPGNERYGYGLVLREYRGLHLAEHGGSMPGFSADLWMAPDHRFALIVLANRDETRFLKTLDRALELMLPVSARPAEMAKPPLLMDQGEMSRYVGRYTNRFTMDVFIRDGRLFLRRFDVEMPITKIGAGRFAVSPPGATRADEFAILPGDGAAPGCLQMFVWSFKRDRQ